MEYLLKASLIVAIFYTCYKLLLQKETFFQSNRLFLLSGIMTALLIPLVVIPIYVTKDASPVLNGYFYEGNAIPISNTNTFNLLDTLPYIYVIGVIILSVKFFLEFGSLIKLMICTKKEKRHPFNFIATSKDVSPFSFFNWIVYNPTQFDNEELKQIIEHEKIHATQFHSIDIILMQIASVIFWFNPFIWLYKKELQQNLEFIADSMTQEIIECSKSYQQLLLKTSVPEYQMALTNNFYNSLIKKRIVMLHKQKSNKINQWKLFTVLPLIALFLISFNTKEIVTYNTLESSEELTLSTTPGDVEFIVIDKNTTNDKLKEISATYDKKGVHLKFKSIKRNDAGEITSIAISGKTENSKVNFNTNDDEAIKPIKITIDEENNKISVGTFEGHSIHLSDDATTSYIVKGNNVVTGHNIKVDKSKKGDNVFIYRSSDNDHEGKHEVIVHGEAHDGKHTKYSYKTKGGKVIDLKSKNGNAFVISGDGAKFEILQADTLEHDGGKFKLKGNTAVWTGKGEGSSVIISTGEGELMELKGDGDEEEIIWKDKDGNIAKSKVVSVGKGKGKASVWINKEDSDKVHVIGNGKSKSSIFISGVDGEKDPLIVVDGKEMKNKKMEDIDPDTIASVSVLKGESAISKYGKKGENGVLVISTKKGNDKIRVVGSGKSKSSIFISDSDGEKDPLLIIDGKETKNKKVEDLDPDTIESVSVLKGASAEKKYGDKGKNGVVEIITKKKKD